MYQVLGGADLCDRLWRNRFLSGKGSGMRVMSSRALRRNLTACLDRVGTDHEPVLITRDGGTPAAVLMSLADYASWEETRFLLSSPRNAERLRRSIAELEAGGGVGADRAGRH
jgi:antitoxin YefM